jgi:hypothetical protein
MPDQFTDGVSFTVTIRVVPPEATFAYAVQDQPPSGWPVTQISNSGTLVGGRVRWVLADGATRTLSYVVTPPANAGGTNYFSGTASFNGVTNIPITGVRETYGAALRLSASTLDLLGDRYTKLTVMGGSSMSYHILVADGLEPGNPWRTNATITLSSPSQDWLDMESVGLPRRFYRAKAAP